MTKYCCLVSLYDANYKLPIKKKKKYKLAEVDEKLLLLTADLSTEKMEINEGEKKSI